MAEEISPDEDLITPERLAKGDLQVMVNSRGNISRAIPRRLTIIKELISNGNLPHYYEVYGHAFLELRDVFRNPWAAKCSALMLEQWGGSINSSQAAEIYENVSRIIGQSRIMLIQYVLESSSEELQEKEEHIEEYKKCFQLLSEVMDSERAKVLAKIKF